MKNIERRSVIDRIGRELQSKMNYGDISRYLSDFGVDVTKETSGINSKWVYTKDLLEGTPSPIIIRIADELGIPHGQTVAPTGDVIESRVWEPNHFRLFLSHLSSFKQTCARLQLALRKFAISAFVAHVDIEPTKEWQAEIEAALFSMDALAAILMPGFKESNWTDQEVGVAIGRGVLIVPIMRGLTPYGLIAKYQGLDAKNRTVGYVAEGVFRILAASRRTGDRMISCVVDAVVRASSVAESAQLLDALDLVGDVVPRSHFERLREVAAQSPLFARSQGLVEKANGLLAKHDLGPVPSTEAVSPRSLPTDDVPF